MGGERSKNNILIPNGLKQKRPVKKLGVPLKKSGKRDSTSRPQPWQGCALPTELLPHTVPKVGLEPTRLQ